MKKLARLLAVSAGVLCCVATYHVTLGAGQAAVPQFKAAVDATTLNVAVVDKNRKPVRGLTREEFTVLEDGKPQRIVSFSEEVLRREMKPGPAWEREFPLDVTTNSTDARRLVVIVMTFTSSPTAGPPDPNAIKKMKQVGHQIVNRLGPDDLGAVVWSTRADASQDLTPDRAKLHAAVDRVRFGDPRGNDRCVVHYLADSLAAYPEKRKLIINIKGPDAAKPFSVMPPSGGSPMPSGTPWPPCKGTSHTFAASLQRANAVFYQFDPNGLMIDKPFDYSENPTAGRTIDDTNAPELHVDEVFVENDGYYLIGYESSSAKAPGAFRHVSVKVNRPGLDVRAPKNVYSDEPSAEELRKNPKKAPAPLMKAMLQALPSSRVALRTVVTPFASTTGKSAATVAIVLGLTLPGEKRGDAVKETVQVEQRAYDLEAHLRGTQSQTAAIALRADGADARLELLSTMELKPGRYQIRTSISSAVLKETASIYSDVLVPDFFDKALTLSGIGLAIEPGVSAAPKDAFAGLMPIVPTSQRDFAAGSSADVFVRIYQQKPGDVTMVAEVRDAADKVVAHEEQLVAAGRFVTNRSADFRWKLPLSKLAAGPYLLTLTSSASKTTAMQSLQFAVR